MEALSPERGSAYTHSAQLTGIGPEQHFIRSYDLESSKSFDQRPDIEYGITITKVGGD